MQYYHKEGYFQDSNLWPLKSQAYHCGNSRFTFKHRDMVF